MKIREAVFIKGAVSPLDFPEDLPEFPVVGRSNVGKSSLINYLCGQKKLVQTSKRPGKTTELNYFRINRRFYLVDVPGFGFTRLGKKERASLLRKIETYFLRSGHIRGVLYLVDLRHSFSAVDAESLEWLVQFDKPLLVVGTKADKLKKQALEQAAANLAREYRLPLSPVLTSSLKKSGRLDILSQIETLLSG